MRLTVRAHLNLVSNVLIGGQSQRPAGSCMMDLALRTPASLIQHDPKTRAYRNKCSAWVISLALRYLTCPRTSSIQTLLLGRIIQGLRGHFPGTEKRESAKDFGNVQFEQPRPELSLYCTASSHCFTLDSITLCFSLLWFQSLWIYHWTFWCASYLRRFPSFSHM